MFVVTNDSFKAQTINLSSLRREEPGRTFKITFCYILWANNEYDEQSGITFDNSFDQILLHLMILIYTDEISELLI